MAPLRRYSGGDLGIGEGGDEFLPVLIVGAGPVGLVLSILLTKLGTLLLIFLSKISDLCKDESFLCFLLV